MDLREAFFLLSRKPFHYRSLFKKNKKHEKTKKRSHWFLLAVCLMFTNFFLQFAGFLQENSEFRDIYQAEIFSLFWKIIHNRLALYFWQNHPIFKEKSYFFLKNKNVVGFLFSLNHPLFFYFWKKQLFSWKLYDFVKNTMLG